MDNINLHEEWSFATYKEQMGFIERTGDTRERILQEYIIRPFLQSLLAPGIDVVPIDVKVPEGKHDYGKYCGRNLAFKDILWSDIPNFQNKTYDSSMENGESDDKREKDKIKGDITIGETKYQWESCSWLSRKKKSLVHYPKMDDKGNYKIKYVTPDLCIAKDWRWNNLDKAKEDYKAIVEVKSIANKGKDNIGIVVSDEATQKQFCENISANISVYKVPITLSDEICVHFRGSDRVIAVDGLTWLLLKKNEGKDGIVEVTCERFVVGRYSAGTKEKSAAIEFFDNAEAVFDELKKGIKEYIG